MRLPSIASLLSFFLAFSAHGAEDFQNVVVKPGDTLWSIAGTYLKDPKKWNELLKYNKLPSSDPSIALPGMVLKVPVSLIKEQYRAAKLVFFENKVLLRKSGAADWNKAVLSMELYRNDVLRTDKEARADVKFHTGEILNLYPNSMAVLRPPDKKDIDVVLMSGEMRGVRSRVVTASARITPGTRDTEFGAKIKDDMTTLVQVYKGLVNVQAQGKTVEVREGFASEVKLDMPPSAPMALPPVAEFEGASQTRLAKAGVSQVKVADGKISLVNLPNVPGRTGGGQMAAPGVDIKNAPQVGDVNADGIDAAEISKLISVANPVQAYHLQLARDPNFTALALNRNYDAFAEIDLAELVPPGSYWMRVSYVDLLGFEGKFNTPRQITVGKRR